MNLLKSYLPAAHSAKQEFILASSRHHNSAAHPLGNRLQAAFGNLPTSVALACTITNRLPYASRCSKRGHSCCRWQPMFESRPVLFHRPCNRHGSSITATAPVKPGGVLMRKPQRWVGSNALNSFQRSMKPDKKRNCTRRQSKRVHLFETGAQLSSAQKTLQRNFFLTPYQRW
jgi:hypothetical protein